MVYTLKDHRNDVKNIEIFAVEPTGVKTMENCHLFVKGKLKRLILVGIQVEK